MTDTKTRLKIGMIGIGVGGAALLPAMAAMDEFELYAGADVVPVTRERFVETYPQAKAYASAEEICADKELDAIWIASPNRFHAEHAILAARSGKHVIVEKPMALTMAQAEEMVKTAQDNGVQLLCGHTMSDPVPIRAMRKIIDSGKLGKVTNIQIFSYTDWLIRPRTADELDITQGGGLPFRQGPRQIDTMRVLAGKRLKSVRGTTGQWMPERPIPGFFTAYFEFEDGMPATILHNGHGYFMTGELIEWVKENDLASLDRRVVTRKAMRSGTRDEEQEKQGMRIGGERRPARRGEDARPQWTPQDPGIIIVSCERGDMRHSRYGLNIYDDDGLHEIDLERPPAGIIREELDQLYSAVVHNTPIFYDGVWGMGTLEACLAMMQSGQEHREIELVHQGAIPPHSDDDIVVSYLGDK
jgi:phthalate 4,5-cis-dihydrodiol dehydrogenase